MNFGEKKQNIHRQLESIYTKLEDDISNCSDMEIMKMLFSNEVKRVSMYADAVKEELAIEIGDELKRRKGKATITEDVNNLMKWAGELIINPIEIDMSKTYTNVEKSQISDINDNRDRDHDHFLDGATIALVGAGLILGGGIGFIATKVITGAAVGAISGAALGIGASTIRKPTVSKHKVIREPIQYSHTKKILDKNYFIWLANNRSMETNGRFLNYVGRVEREVNNYFNNTQINK